MSKKSTPKLADKVEKKILLPRETIQDKDSRYFTLANQPIRLGEHVYYPISSYFRPSQYLELFINITINLHQLVHIFYALARNTYRANSLLF